MLEVRVPALRSFPVLLMNVLFADEASLHPVFAIIRARMLVLGVLVHWKDMETKVMWRKWVSLALVKSLLSEGQNLKKTNQKTGGPLLTGHKILPELCVCVGVFLFLGLPNFLVSCVQRPLGIIILCNHRHVHLQTKCFSLNTNVQNYTCSAHFFLSQQIKPYA